MREQWGKQSGESQPNMDGNDLNIFEPEYGLTLFKNNSFNFSFLTLDTIFTQQSFYSKFMIQLLVNTEQWVNSSFRLLAYHIDIESLVVNPQMDYYLLLSSIFMHI